jgi:hypothetical protein
MLYIITTYFSFSIFRNYGANNTNKRKREDNEQKGMSKKPALNEGIDKANQEESIPKNEPKKEPKLKEREVIPSGSDPTTDLYIPDAGPNPDEPSHGGSDEMDYPSDMDIDIDLGI